MIKILYFIILTATSLPIVANDYVLNLKSDSSNISLYITPQEGEEPIILVKNNNNIKYTGFVSYTTPETKECEFEIDLYDTTIDSSFAIRIRFENNNRVKSMYIKNLNNMHDNYYSLEIRSRGGL